jgi:hypothetical protein
VIDSTGGFNVAGPGNPPSPPAREFLVPGWEIGGESGVNDLTFTTTEVNGSGQLVAAVYVSGTIPGGSPAPTPTLPTVGNPTKVVTISPMASEFIQIPSSSTGDTVLYGSGADVYVTPVQIIA